MYHPWQVEGRLAGDSLELSALQGSGWQYDGNRSLALPPPTNPSKNASSSSGGGLRIVFRHPFSAELQVGSWRGKKGKKEGRG